MDQQLMHLETLSLPLAGFLIQGCIDRRFVIAPKDQALCMASAVPIGRIPKRKCNVFQMYLSDIKPIYEDQYQRNETSMIYLSF